jgi:hypothetical protein
MRRVPGCAVIFNDGLSDDKESVMSHGIDSLLSTQFVELCMLKNTIKVSDNIVSDVSSTTPEIQRAFSFQSSRHDKN